MAVHGRCRPGSAAWSATRWCVHRRWCSARPVSSTGWCSRPRDGEELTPIEDDDAPFVEEESDRSSVSLGWVFHAIMSAKARIGWLLATAYRSLVASAPQPRTLSFER